jgi:hypothetical protein
MKFTHVAILALIAIIIGLAWLNIEARKNIREQRIEIVPAQTVTNEVLEEKNIETPPVEEVLPVETKPSGNDVGMEYPEIDILPGDTDATPVACTMDAKICPDGSAVGRVGPNCEFAPCP